jgi:hypothetical protein
MVEARLMQSHGPFIEWARDQLRRSVRDCLGGRREGDEEAPSISESEYAYEAAIAMRAQRRQWLAVRDDHNDVIGSVDATALGNVLKLMDAAPLFGEDMLTLILPRVRQPAVQVNH